MVQSVHVLVFDGFADWEPALALAELRRSGPLNVVAVGFDSQPVTSMGGLHVQPSLRLDEVNLARVCLFMLPGGTLWEDGSYPRDVLEPLLRELEQDGTPLAGICAGTVPLARIGLFDNRRHTSNGRAYLEAMHPAYAAGASYVDDLAVRDRSVISASGLGYVEFAREVMTELDVLSPDERAIWYRAFKTGAWPS